MVGPTCIALLWSLPVVAYCLATVVEQTPFVVAAAPCMRLGGCARCCNEIFGPTVFCIMPVAPQTNGAGGSRPVACARTKRLGPLIGTEILHMSTIGRKRATAFARNTSGRVLRFRNGNALETRRKLHKPLNTAGSEMRKASTARGCKARQEGAERGKGAQECAARRHRGRKIIADSPFASLQSPNSGEFRGDELLTLSAGSNPRWGKGPSSPYKSACVHD